MKWHQLFANEQFSSLDFFPSLPRSMTSQWYWVEYNTYPIPHQNHEYLGLMTQYQFSEIQIQYFSHLPHLQYLQVAKNKEKSILMQSTSHLFCNWSHVCLKFHHCCLKSKQAMLQFRKVILSQTTDFFEVVFSMILTVYDILV